METRTEYAIRYTGRQFGKTATLIHEVQSKPGDLEAAEATLEHFRENWHPEAVLVSRTVTITDWVETDPYPEIHAAAVRMRNRSNAIADRTYTGQEVTALMHAFVSDPKRIREVGPEQVLAETLPASIDDDL